MDNKASEDIVSAEDSDKRTRDAPSPQATSQQPQETVHEDATKQDVLTQKVDTPLGKDSVAQNAQEGQQVPSETHESDATTPASTPPTQNYVPPVKRFSSVNINKKFLQKNHPTPSSLSATGSSVSSSSKQPGLLGLSAPQSSGTLI